MADLQKESKQRNIFSRKHRLEVASQLFLDNFVQKFSRKFFGRCPSLFSLSLSSVFTIQKIFCCFFFQFEVVC